MKAPTTLAKLLLIAVVATVATTGCATGGTLPSRAVADRQTAVTIRNNNWSDVTVYLVQEGGGIPVRLRRVGSFTTERIPLRARIRSYGQLQFLIRPFASSTTFTTHSVDLTPGDLLHLTVENYLAHSTLVRRLQ